ncbi:MAG: ankyrin repeat domain-containing protein [Planctomycetaceae bacterium]|nr:ankyrin repeat domain-containing protein [Planctomycetaceae bacterium]
MNKNFAIIALAVASGCGVAPQMRPQESKQAVHRDNVAVPTLPCMSPLCAAIREGTLEDPRRYGDFYGYPCRKCGRKPLLAAIETDNEKMIAVVLKFATTISDRSDIPADDSNLTKEEYKKLAAWAVTPAGMALIHNKANALRALAAHGASLEERPFRGRSLLHLAAQTGSYAVVEDFLAKGADPSSADPVGLTPLHCLALACARTEWKVDIFVPEDETDMADDEAMFPDRETLKILRSTPSAGDYAQTVKVLCSKGAEINSNAGPFKRTPLLTAALRGNPEVVKVLLEAGAAPTIRGADLAGRPNKGLTPLMAAIVWKFPLVQRVLLDHHVPIDVHSAAALGKTNVLADLLKRKPSLLNESDGLYCAPPIFWAVWHKQPGATRFLLEKGASTNCQARYGATLLHLAVAQKNYSLAADLLKRGAPAEKDAFLFCLTPLMRAVREEDVQMIQTLLSGGAKPGTQNRFGLTALHLAVARQNMPIVRMLLEKGAPPSPLADYGHEEWFTAYGIRTPELARAIYQTKGDPSRQAGYTPLQQAVASKNVDLVRVLLAAGADPTIKNPEGKTAMDYASGATAEIKSLLQSAMPQKAPSRPH